MNNKKKNIKINILDKSFLNIKKLKTMIEKKIKNHA